MVVTVVIAADRLVLDTARAAAAARIDGAMSAIPTPTIDHPVMPATAVHAVITTTVPRAATAPLTWSTRSRSARATKWSPAYRVIAIATTNSVYAVAATAEPALCRLLRSTAAQLLAPPSTKKPQNATVPGIRSRRPASPSLPEPRAPAVSGNHRTKPSDQQARAVARVQAGLLRSTPCRLQFDAGGVHGDIDDAVDGGPDRCGQREPRQRGCGRQRAQQHREAQRADAENAAAPVPAYEQAAQRQPEDRAALDGKDDEAQAAGRQSEPLLSIGQSACPRRRDETGDDEERHDCPAVPSHLSSRTRRGSYHK
jgi:hypothetical protein